MIEQLSQEWFDVRAGKMTCSRMAEAVGLIGSRKRLWRELTGRERGKRASEQMQDGIAFEPLGVAVYEQRTGFVCERAGFVVHPDIPWIGGSPDRLLADARLYGAAMPRGGIEVKCPVAPYAEVPPYHLPQMQGLMEVTDRPWWDFVAWTPELVRCWRVFRSVQYWTELYQRLCEFWLFIETDTEPPAFKRGTKPTAIAVDVPIQLLFEE